MVKQVGIKNRTQIQGTLFTYLQTKINMCGAQTVTDYRRLSSQTDLIRRAFLYMAVGHHLSADVLLGVETESDLLLVPGL